MDTSWIKTQIGLQMAKIIVKYIPRITVCLEEIAKELKIKNEREETYYDSL
jgi:hypothetical protein